MIGYAKYMQILIDGLVQFNIQNPTNIEVASIPITTLNIINWPEDMTDYVLVGLVVNERIWSFTYNPNIALMTDFSCGTDTRSVTESNSNIYFMGGNSEGIYIPPTFGTGGGYNSNYFRIDKKRRLIIIEGELPSGNRNVYLQYLGTGIDLGGNTVIPRKIKPVLLAFLAWKDVEYLDSVSPYEKKERENQYGIELQKVTEADFRWSLQEYMDYYYMSSKQAKL